MLWAAVTKTKALILNSPSNPSGAVYTEKELEKLAEECVRSDIYVISDEIYYKLVYGNAKFRSLASFGEDIKRLTILINGVSKSYSMTGWRIGYSCSDESVAKVIGNLQSLLRPLPTRSPRWLRKPR